MSIRSKFILALAFSLSAVALGTSLAVRLFAVEETETAFAQNAAVHMDRVEDIIHAYFAAGSDAAKTLANLPESTDDALLKEPGGDNAAAKAALLRRLESIRAVVPGAEAVFCGYKNGVNFAVPEGGDISPEEAHTSDFRKRGWYSDAVLGAAQTFATDAYISSTSKSLAATISTKIKNAQGETLGAAAISISLASLTDTLRDIQMGKGGYLVIFDAKSRVILDPKAQENLLRPVGKVGDGALATLAQLPSGVHGVTREGAEYAAYARVLALPGWKAVILMDRNVLFGSAKNLTFATVLVVLALSCAVFGLGFLVVIGITRPLQALIRQSSALADGNTDALAVIPGRGPDIAVLHGNLGRLTGRIMLLLQAEKERMNEAANITHRAVENRQETARLETSLREARIAERHTKIETLQHIVSGLAAAVEALSVKSREAREQAEIQLHTADETRDATVSALNDATIYARQATETEINANSSLSLVSEIGAKIAETARGLNGTKNTMFTLAGNLETMKADIAEMAEMASSVREIAEQANLLGFNVSLDANSTGSDAKTLPAIVEKIRAIAENTMTVAGTVDAVTASLEQQHAAQAHTLNKSLSALKRASSGNANAEKAAAAALMGSATAAEQFRILATALEGAVQAGNSYAEPMGALLHASRNVTGLLQEMDDSVLALTALSARLAMTVEEWANEKR